LNGFFIKFQVVFRIAITLGGFSFDTGCGSLCRSVSDFGVRLPAEARCCSRATER
jgi:hypothetical protein